MLGEYKNDLNKATPTEQEVDEKVLYKLNFAI